ncbi:ferric reductase-like transmembrane domain-containing protein [Actinoplanes sp. NPDC051470]|uniref:ferric reductase-like transmembrane domain-containing protein n=1 Tax=unclassified Actinoplanes TaxID=2626549 RepID=UPI003417B919
MTDALWYTGRGTGVMTLVLLSIVVALGIAARDGRTAFGLPRFVVNLVHRNAALLALTMLLIHVVTLLFDPYAKLTPLDLIVPFAGDRRPFWLGLGTLALDTLAAIAITTALRHRLGVRTWRIVHWLAYLSWPLALLHGIQTGTDARAWWMWTIVAACGALVLAAVAWRLSPNFGRPRLRRYGHSTVPPSRPARTSVQAVPRSRVVLPGDPG